MPRVAECTHTRGTRSGPQRRRLVRVRVRVRARVRVGVRVRVRVRVQVRVRVRVRVRALQRARHLPQLPLELDCLGLAQRARLGHGPAELPARERALHMLLTHLLLRGRVGVGANLHRVGRVGGADEGNDTVAQHLVRVRVRVRIRAKVRVRLRVRG